MKRVVIFFLFFVSLIKAQNPIQYNHQKQSSIPKVVYELRSYHLPFLVGSSLLYSYGNILVRKKSPLTEQDLLFLNRNAVNSIDRYATHFWSPTVSKVSDVTLILSALSTPLLFKDNKIRKEWFTIGFMFLEASVLTYGITQTSKGLTDRLRPYVYNSNAPLEKKLQIDAKNSFFSGHTALSATYSFMTYKIFSDFYPQSKLKPYFLVGAICLPLLTASARVFSGKHYLSDVLTGYVIGAAVGYGLPFLYKNKEKHLSLNTSIQILILPI